MTALESAVAEDYVLARVDKARALLAEASDAGKAKQVADIAKAAEVYAKRQRLSDETIRYATAVRVDATALMGEHLKRTEKDTGGRPAKTGSKKEPVIEPPPTLAELGIDKKESSDAQALAEVKADEPEVFEQVRNGEISIRAAASRVRRKKKKKRREKEDQKRRSEVEVSTDERFVVEPADCLRWLAAQPAGSIDLVFGSPPYEDARTYAENGGDPGITRKTDEWVAWMVEVYKTALRCCRGLVAFVVEGRTKKYCWSASPVLLMADLARTGICLRKPPIYRRVGIPGSGGPDWLRNDYEFIVCATNGGELPWSENTAMGKPPKYEPGGDPSHRQRDGRRVNAREGTGRASMKDRNRVGHHRARQQAGRRYDPPDLANPGNIITCKVGGGNMGDKLSHENEAPFPEYLVEFFVRSFCPPGGVVADPFCGSGTTGAVAVRHGRFFRGCDSRESQVKLSRKRISKVQPTLPVIGE
jgi:hypothetical protein